LLCRVKKFLFDLRSTLSTLEALPIPTISAISGFALGGGLEIGLSTTFRVATANSVLALPETRLAIVPGAGGTYRLPRIVGKTRALDLILSGRRLDGNEAYRIGLIDRVVPEEQEDGASAAKPSVDDSAVQAAIEFGMVICSGAPIAVTQAFKAVKGSEGGEEVENKAYEVMLGTQDRIRALKAFAQKQSPNFEGN
jgi:methylglutaconyl-CoA hydratase